MPHVSATSIKWQQQLNSNISAVIIDVLLYMRLLNLGHHEQTTVASCMYHVFFLPTYKYLSKTEYYWLRTAADSWQQQHYTTTTITTTTYYYFGVPQ